jgi:hypothetical protein
MHAHVRSPGTAHACDASKHAQKAPASSADLLSPLRFHVAFSLRFGGRLASMLSLLGPIPSCKHPCNAMLKPWNVTHFYLHICYHPSNLSHLLHSPYGPHHTVLLSTTQAHNHCLTYLANHKQQSTLLNLLVARPAHAPAPSHVCCCRCLMTLDSAERIARSGSRS